VALEGAEGRGVVAEGRGVVAEGRGVVAEGKPVVAEGKPAVAAAGCGPRQEGAAQQAVSIHRF